MADKYNIPTGYNSGLVQQAMQYGDQAVDAQKNMYNETIGTAEQGMYEMLGKMQLQNERAIADRRMKALRSGTTSSGLAALEMQNIQAGQIGATQVMQDARNQRLMMDQELAGRKENNRYYALELLNQNTKDIAAIDAQKYASSIIPGLKEDYPNATSNQIYAMAAQQAGIPLTDAQQSEVDSMSTVLYPDNPELYEGTKPIGERDFVKNILGKGALAISRKERAEYEKYVENFNNIKNSDWKTRSIFAGVK
jgi:hypothetical protein